MRVPTPIEHPLAHDTFRNVRHNLLAQVFNIGDLLSLSVSSVGPLFSIAAAGGAIVKSAGWYSLLAIGIVALPFIASSFIFRMLNQHFPHAGASYHWSKRVLGRKASRFQAWILIIAYFASIPPIIIPASSYTLSLVAPDVPVSSALRIMISAFWVGFALIPLLTGGRPTVKFTKVFLIIELFSLGFLVVLSILRWSSLYVGIHQGPISIGGVLIGAVMAATIMDGWEIDSYAAEEANRPRTDPGKAGILGAFLALAFYAVIFPLMLAETPLNRLAGSTNPLAIWGTRLVPEAPWLILIPVLASTAGGLWLTSYILSRALFAMGRESLLPKKFAHVSKKQTPSVAVIVPLTCALGIVGLQVIDTSLNSFFELVLSSAGFFLVAEFFLDSLTASVFLIRRTGSKKRGLSSHLPFNHHKILGLMSVTTTAILAFLMLGFLIYAPQSIGWQVDLIVAILIISGAIFSLTSRHNPKDGFVFHFHGQDIFRSDHVKDISDQSANRRAIINI
ncbi:MAG: APC family permease [Actinobacteria bacterium]|nr:APC family permease [Actinomycetota bacterium]MCL6104959.1 APC family permease [Actinomycetota bacterium]